jgi:chorismate mutase
MVESLIILRNKIDDFDREIVSILKRRFNIVKKVGKFKKKHNLPLCDRKRQAEVLKIRVKQGKTSGLNEKFAKNLYNLIFNEAIRIQGEKK